MKSHPKNLQPPSRLTPAEDRAVPTSLAPDISVMQTSRKSPDNPNIPNSSTVTSFDAAPNTRNTPNALNSPNSPDSLNQRSRPNSQPGAQEENYNVGTFHTALRQTFPTAPKGCIPRDIRLLLLDFDGTLADTRRANYLAYADTLRGTGRGITEQEYFEKYFGMRCMEFLQQLGFDNPAERERLQQRKIGLYPSHFGSVRLNRPLWEFMQTFRSEAGKAWIVSTGSRDNIMNVMRHMGINGGIDGLITGVDVERSKPAPDCFLKVMRSEGVAPEETLIFEDSTIGIEAARASGAFCTVIKWQ